MAELDHIYAATEDVDILSRRCFGRCCERVQHAPMCDIHYEPGEEGDPRLPCSCVAENRNN